MEPFSSIISKTVIFSSKTCRWFIACLHRFPISVQLESGTRQNLCFYALRDNGGGDGQITGAGGWALLWLGQTFVPDIPEWQIARFPPKLPHEIGQIADQQTKKTEGVLFQLKLLWYPPFWFKQCFILLFRKASIVRNDGTVSTVFGEKVADQK